MISKFSREALISSVSETKVDVIVVGGGITGAGILQELARRGLKSVLLEQKDFAWGTSSRSTKMVHGGLRYLKEGNISLTRESVLERENLIRELPGLVTNKTFILPFYKEKWLSRLTLHLGLIVYDFLSRTWRKHICSLSEMEKRAPHVDQKDLKGGFLVHDAVTDDARLTTRVLAEAIKNGATAINYCQVKTLLKENNRVCGVVFQDCETETSHQIKAQLVINATGAWADRLRTEVQKKNKDRIRPLRGSHLVLSAEKLPLVDNISMIHPRDGRPLIALAWEGRILAGTTDVDHEKNLDKEAAISADEVLYILEALNHQFPTLDIQPLDIISTQAGIRPVIDTKKENPSAESRDHAIWNEDGLLTVTGGKMTTFRAIALDALKVAQQVIGKLPDLDKKQTIFEKTPDLKLLEPRVLSPEIGQRLVGRYGFYAIQIVKDAQEGELSLIPGTLTIWAELRWAARHELIVHLDDLLLRRTRLGLLLRDGGKAEMIQIQKICQSELGWDSSKWKEEVLRYFDLWQKYYCLPQLPN